MPALSSSAAARLLPLALDGGRYAVRCITGDAPHAPTQPLAFEPFLYLTPAHVALQRHPGEQLRFYLEDARQTAIIASFQVFIEADTRTAYSPWQAPFGSVQLAEGITSAVVLAFLQQVGLVLQEHGVQQVQVRCYPFAYDPMASTLLTQAFTQLGAHVALAELNNHLELTDLGFEARLHPSERRRLQKCRRAGFQFEQEPPLLLPLAYAFLQQCRAEKGQTLSLSLERLQELFRLFPQDHFLFSVRDNKGDWAALTVAIRVNGQLLYNFYPASPLAYNVFSPVVLLNEGLYSFAHANGMRLLDLGTSTLPEGPNHSLLQFKRHLGGVLSLKLTFAWAL
ncbi:hypothetical protein [Hymenobacter crusticola]|uniref:BioF2-like acetyltransferase domain-containing protein n=1 Tax=Hymenobacter crusticola TaxID=1770526 RepID=A0A243WFB7_9BACT|nr:hypothetical protein [Hymenobacter crusticola]OUJ74466.1 hypothetical protein BXP70_06680 [Hymenobacter crusticola]